MKIVATIFCVLMIAGCTSRQVISRCAPIPIPEFPDRLEWRTPSSKEEAGVTLLDPPTLLKPNEQAKAPDTGAALMTPRTWRGLKYGLEEWPRWGNLMKANVEAHNKAIKEREQPKSTWQKWFGE